MTGDFVDECPVCDWDGTIACTTDRTHEYYTHLIVEDGELFMGRTCSMRTHPPTRRFPWAEVFIGLLIVALIAIAYAHIAGL